MIKLRSVLAVFRYPRFAYIASTSVLLYALVSLYKIASSYAPDFSVFYDAARGLIAHKNIYTLPMYTGLGYPPFTLLPFIPFTLLPYAVAQVVWVALSFALFLASIYLSLRAVRKKVRLTEFCAVFIFSFMAFPVKFTFGMGQINFAALALLLTFLWCAIQKKRVWSGIALGMLFILKPHFIILLPAFLLTGEWMSVLISVVLLGASMLLTGVLFDWSQFAYYFHTTVPPLLAFAGRGIYYDQGLGSFFTRTLPVPLAGELTTWVGALLAVLALWFIWNKGLTLFESVMVTLPVFLLIEPLSWQHHYVFLLPVYVWLVDRSMKRKDILILLVLSYLLVGINIHSPNILQALPFSGIILSHVFLGNVLLLSLVIHETA